MKTCRRVIQSGGLISYAVILLFHVSVNYFPAHAQSGTLNEVKNLKEGLPAAKGEKKIKIYLSLCSQYFSISADSSLYFSREALKISEAIGDHVLAGRSHLGAGHSLMMTGQSSQALYSYLKAEECFKKAGDTARLATCYVALGQYFYYKSEYDKALTFYNLSLACYRKVHDPESYSNIVMTLNEIGDMYYDQANFKQALDYLIFALKISEAVKSCSNMTPSLLTSIGNVYFDWKHFDMSLEYYFKAYRIYKHSGENKSLAYCLNNIGRVYFETGSYDTAIYYYRIAAELFEKINDNFGIAASNTYIGNYYRIKKKHKEALRFYDIALGIYSDINQPSQVAGLLHEKARLYFNMDMPQKALENSMQSLSIARSISSKEQIYANYLLLSEIFSSLDSCQKAFGYFKSYTILRDSIFNLDIHKQISEMKEKYEAEKRSKEIQTLKHREEIQNIRIHNQTIVRDLLIAGAGILMILVLVILRSYRNKRRANIIIAAEKKKSDDLLMNILPEQTAEELKINGFAKTRSYEMVSVLFTDFKGFTIIAEQLSAEELVSELDHCFTAFDKIVERNYMEKIKTIGDSYMCAGGIPVPNTSNPSDAVNCGLEMCRFINKYKEERIKQGKPFFEVRVGVHTGPVISGIVGTKKFAYDIWGDTVNIAARMESSGKPGCVNISGDTYEHIKDKFTCTYRGKIEAKNKGLTDMYFVEGLQML